MKGLNVLLTGACGRIGKTFFEASKDRYRFTLTDPSPSTAIASCRPRGSST